MGILIGMDEAGYGPHLGPLVVAATAWEVADEHWGAAPRAGRQQTKSHSTSANSDTCVATKPRIAKKKKVTADAVDLYSLLRNVVAKTANERRVPIADSKILYHPGNGLRHLERGLHAVLLSMQQTLSNWSSIVDYCGADPEVHHRAACWPTGFDCSLPVDAAVEELSRLADRFSRACQAAGARPLFIRARLICPAQFNELIDHYGNKAAALSHVTVGLLREVMDGVALCPTPERRALTPTYVVCDKHGGRNFYTSLLQHHFSEHWIAPVFESHLESHYEWGEPERSTRVVFRVNGETFLPTALASMTAKYLRELAMRAFNEFWRAHVAELRPTAGYYRDAWRFKKDIAAKQHELAIDDHYIWRNR
jgi:hypothetical protein